MFNLAIKDKQISQARDLKEVEDFSIACVESWGNKKSIKPGVEKIRGGQQGEMSLGKRSQTLK